MTWRIYIAGPIMAPGADGSLPTGLEVKARRRKFGEVAEWIRREINIDTTMVINPLEVPACGSIPENPHMQEDLPRCNVQGEHPLTGTHSWQCFLRYDLKALVMCDEVVMLEGWEGSPGAKVEFDVANSLGLQVNYWCTKHRNVHYSPCDKDEKECQGV